MLFNEKQDEAKAIKANEGPAFFVDSPGEYESQGVVIKGISAQGGIAGKENKEKITIYYFEAEGIKLCHLGTVSQTELSPEQVEVIDGVDVLMIPVGGGWALDSEGAHKVINQLEPKIVIPMNYQLAKLKKELKDVLQPKELFLKSMGQEEGEEQSSLKIKKANLPAQTKIIILKA